MSNNEKFNTLLNSCAHPHQICNTLLAFAEVGYQLKNLTQNLEDIARQDGLLQFFPCAARGKGA